MEHGAWRKMQRGLQTMESFLSEMDGEMNKM